MVQGSEHPCEVQILARFQKAFLAGEVKTEKLVIVINGAGGVGKDTLIGAVADKYKTRNISSVDPIKAMARMAGWDGDKSDKSRKMLSDLKDIFTEYNDLSLSYVKSQHEQFMKSDEQVLFVHIREPDQIERFRNIAPKQIYTLLISRQDQNKIYGNSADDDVKNYPYDFYFDNSLGLNASKEAFIKSFDEWFSLLSFETEITKTISGVFKNGLWDIAVACGSPNNIEETRYELCDVRITEYATDGKGARLLSTHRYL